MRDALPTMPHNGVKRAFDIVVASVGLIVLAPVFAAVSIAVAACLGRPILFRHLRPGYNKRTFLLYKFRTMRELPDGNCTLSDAERLTTFGRWLRRSSLDELPELFNVLRGDMSLVGPRPLLMEYLPLYTAQQSRRHEVRPGLTGWAQIHGRNDISWEDKLALDVWYVEHQSMWLDLRILLSTVVLVLVGKGVSQRGHATAEKFTGSSKSSD